MAFYSLISFMTFSDFSYLIRCSLISSEKTILRVSMVFPGKKEPACMSVCASVLSVCLSVVCMYVSVCLNFLCNLHICYFINFITSPGQSQGTSCENHDVSVTATHSNGNRC